MGSHQSRHLFPFSQSAQWEFLSSMLTKFSPPLGQELEPSWHCYLCLSQVSAVVAYLVGPSVALTVLWDRQLHALNPYTTPWESCCLTWTVKIPCTLLSFQVSQLHDRGSRCTGADQSVTYLVFKAGRMHQRMTGYICVHLFSSEASETGLCHKKRHRMFFWLSVVWMEKICFYSLETESSEL